MKSAHIAGAVPQYGAGQAVIMPSIYHKPACYNLRYFIQQEKS